MALHRKPRKIPLVRRKILNLPSVDLPITPLTKEDVDRDIGRRLSHINREFQIGFNFIKKYPQSVTFFGSARLKENSSYYQQAKELGKALSVKGYTVITGGGPGVMEAANRGAEENHGESLGLAIRLPDEQVTNPYLSDFREFHYFFTRKVCLTFSAEAYVYFPGGYGTLDEFFEILTLVQTKKIHKVPIILFGSDFWKPICDMFEEHLLEKFDTISPPDIKLYHITDSIADAVNIIKQAPIRNDYDAAYSED